MKILLVNQAFYPDVVASAQYLTDLATRLEQDGHAVTVLTAATGYSDSARRFPARETWKGIEIIRVSAPRFNKRFRLSRLLDVAGHITAFATRLFVLPRFDVVVALTSPPLVSVLAALTSRLRGSRTVLWIMDLNPDEAVAAGWLRPGSVTTRALERLLGYSLVTADLIIALDRFMKQRIVAKGIDEAKVVVLPPWSHDDDVTFDEEARQAFRRTHHLEDRFVVMYAGNHSPCYPLDTLLEAARQLRTESRIVFCFVGGGSRIADVGEFVRTHGLHNVRQLPYQPREGLGGMLSAADLHVVTMGDRFVGIVHPCKIYNILRVGSPVLSIGPAASHLVDLGAGLPAGHLHPARHGDVASVAEAVLSAHHGWHTNVARPRRSLDTRHQSAELLPQLVARITSITRADRLHGRDHRLDPAGAKEGAS